jgi:hypothetical protein
MSRAGPVVVAIVLGNYRFRSSALREVQISFRMRSDGKDRVPLMSVTGRRKRM